MKINQTNLSKVQITSIEERLKRTDCEGIFKLEKTNDSFKIIKINE